MKTLVVTLLSFLFATQVFATNCDSVKNVELRCQATYLFASDNPNKVGPSTVLGPEMRGQFFDYDNTYETAAETCWARVEIPEFPFGFAFYASLSADLTLYYYFKYDQGPMVPQFYLKTQLEQVVTSSLWVDREIEYKGRKTKLVSVHYDCHAAKK